MPDGGYGAGLFDSSGPKAFAAEVGKISDSLTSVQSAFTNFGGSAQQTLNQISTALQDVITKLGQVGAGLPNWGGGQGQPSTPSGGPMITNPGGWNNPRSPNAQTGTADPLTGMVQDTANQGPKQFPKQQPTVPSLAPTTQGSGMPQGTASTMAQRAAQSMIPAAIGAATNYAGGAVATAVQGQTIGAMEAPFAGVSQRSLYVQPQGILAQNNAQYAQSNYYALQNMGMLPGTAQWTGLQQGANAMMTLLPGLQRPQAFADINQMQQPTALNAGLMFGFNFKPGGQQMMPQQEYQQVFQKLAQNVGGKPTAQQVQDWLTTPGGPWQQNIAQLGWTPGTDQYQGFVQYVQTQVGMQGQGKSLAGINLGTASGAKQTPLGQSSGYQQLQTQSTLAQTQSQAEPALAQASENLNKAAQSLLDLVNPLGSLLGGGGGAGGAAASWGGTVLGLGGMYVGGKAISSVGGKVLSKLPGIGGIFGGKGGGGINLPGGLTVPGKTGSGSTLGNLLKGGWGKISGIFGGGGGEAAAGEAVGTGAEVGGLEAAGAAADATGVGLPLGLALGAAGLGVGAFGLFHKQIGGFFGGLFGGHKKKTTSAPDGSETSDAAGDMPSLLSGVPAKNSLIACLTAPIQRNSNTLAAALVYGTLGDGGPSIGAGGSILQAALTGAPSPVSLGAVGAMGAPGSRTFFNAGATDLSSLFTTGTSNASSSTSNASGSGGTGSGSSSNTVTPTGGNATGTAAQNQALGQQMAAAMGWTGAEWTALNNVEMAEGGWSTTAKNPISGAYGIAQFIGGPSEYPTYGGDAGTAKGQITGFLNYVKQRYGTPTKAWAHEQQYNWYARGSQLIDRTQLAVLHKGEAVIPAQDNYSTTPYNKNGTNGSSPTVYLQFKAGSVVLQVSGNPTQQDMKNVAEQFVTAISQPAVLAGVRST